MFWLLLHLSISYLENNTLISDVCTHRVLPESAGGVKAAQAEVSKINILSGSKVARLTRQPSIFISGTYLFILLFGQSGHGEVT